MKKLVFVLVVPALTLAIYDMRWFDLNNSNVPFMNDGRWGYDPTPTGAGGSVPRSAESFFVFGAGQWLGAVVPSPPPETLCTVFYNPNSGGGEGYPTLSRYWRAGHGDSLDRLYKHPGDWPPPASRFPMAPQDPRSDMDLWSCFCDSNPAAHTAPGRPIGFDVCLSVYGFAESLAQDFFFLKYGVANCLGDTIRDAHFGMTLDADVGSGSDDLTGLILDGLFQVGQETIRVRNTGLVYNGGSGAHSSASWESETLEAVAVMLLSAPDTLGLTAFKRLAVDIDPVTDGEQYLTLAGYDYRTGAYEPYDSTDNYPSDKRVLLASGPFDLAPDSTVTFWYTVIRSPFPKVGQWPWERDTSELAKRCKWALEYFGRLLPGIAEATPLPDVRAMNAATIVRGVLFLPRDMTESSDDSDRVPRPALLDISGSKVMDLAPGANDVRHLSPGVYFVRSEFDTRHPSLTTKVVVTR